MSKKEVLAELKILFLKGLFVSLFGVEHCFVRSFSLDSCLCCPHVSLPWDFRLLRNLRKLEAGNTTETLHHPESRGRRSIILTSRLSSLVQLPILLCGNLSASGNLKGKRRVPLCHPALSRPPSAV